MNSKQNTSAKHKEKKETVANDFTPKRENLFGMILILVASIIMFYAFLFKGYEPIGLDSAASLAETKYVQEYNLSSGDKALWNPAIFGGMPLYPRLYVDIINFDTIIGYAAKLFYWGWLYLVAGGIGLFFFLRSKKFNWLIATICAIAFMLLPDWMALVGEGHNTKFRALMVFPTFLLSFDYLFNKRTWLSVGFFGLVFSWLIRTQHMQIVFYGVLLLFILYIYPYLKLILNKEYKLVSVLTGKFAVGIVLALMTAAIPFLTLKEYASFSTRGGSPVNIVDNDNSAEKSGGVSFEYATQWSQAPSEVMDFFILRFHGGYSGEIYDGSKFAEYKGQQVPGYWGQKPYNGNYAFVGSIIFSFAILGLYFYRKDKFVISLGVFSAFSLLLSFGFNFPALYKLFFYYMPYFSKFRAPAIIVNVTFFTMIILAAYGLKAFLENELKDKIKILAPVLGFGLILAVMTLLLKGSISFASEADLKNYDSNTINILKEMRSEMLTSDTVRLLIISLIFLAGSVFFILKKIPKMAYVILAGGLIIFEIGGTTKQAYDKIKVGDKAALEAEVFSANPVSEALAAQSKDYRAIAIGRLFQDNHFAYYHPLINGYSAIKLQLIQDIIENNLYNANTPDKINWNVINMLGGRYVILNGEINIPFLSLIQKDDANKIYLYNNQTALPKAWLVKTIESTSDKKNVLIKMNQPEFRPDSVAYVYSEKQNIQNYSGEGSIKLKGYSPNEIKFECNVAGNQFAVISEVYYPVGWKAFVNGKETEIKQVNHILRGVELPAGNYKLELKFEPESYSTGTKVAWAGNLILVLMILISVILEVKKKKEAENK